MKLKKLVAVLMVTFLSLTLAQAAAKADKNQLKVKAGDTAYVCECGSKCGCEVAAMKAGKCGCGHDLAKVSVTKVKGNRAFYEANGKQQQFKLTGKYSCGCGSDCCQMVSNKAGKCACGKDLVAASKS